MPRPAVPSYAVFVSVPIAMVKPRPSLLAATLLLTPLAQALGAELCPAPGWSCERVEGRWRCSGMPDSSAAGASAAADREQATLTLRAERLEGEDGKHVELIGEARAERADQQLDADRIRYEIETEQATASGVVHYEDSQNSFYATNVQAELANDRTTLTDVRYALKDRRGQGSAAKAVAEGGTRTALESVSYSTCPGDDPSWQIEASTLDVDHEAGSATARDFKLRLGGVPVFYAPYASFPIDDRRKSGVLSPRIGGGSDGLDLALPYYFNLAPNYDATLTPRWISNRGGQIGGELRYLYRNGRGQVDGEWMPNDSRFGGSRDRLRIQHYGQLNPWLRLDADLNAVSDDRYFVDLGDSLNASSTSVIGSILSLSGGNRQWRYSALADRYQLILPDVPEAEQNDPYRRLPRLSLEYAERRGPIHYGFGAEWVAFRRDDFCLPGSASGQCQRVSPIEGNRLDVSPYLGHAWEPAWGFVRSRASLRHTRYHLRPNDAMPPGTIATSDRLQRTTPIFSVDSGLLFERGNAFGNSNWRQTLEPRMYYLYAAERDQSAIPVFDSAELDFSFAQLFRENRYTGADRQSNANQLTLALSSRLLDDADGRERVALSVGQIRYFDPPSVFLPSELLAGAIPDRQRSAYVAEVRGELGGNWSFNSALRYDPVGERTDFAAVRLQRRFGQDGLMNIGYRYRPDRLEQTDLAALIPISEHWRAVMRWNYSLRERTTLDAVAGVEYRNCCYSVRLLSRRYLRGIGTEHRNALFVEFELAGLGSLGRDTGEFLRRAILGYQPFGGSAE